MWTWAETTNTTTNTTVIMVLLKVQRVEVGEGLHQKRSLTFPSGGEAPDHARSTRLKNSPTWLV
jgi:hypothetical protein